MNQSSNKEKIRQLIVDLQQDVKSYGELRASLDQQRSLLIAHDNQGLQASIRNSSSYSRCWRSGRPSGFSCWPSSDSRRTRRECRPDQPVAARPVDRVNQLWSQLHQLLLACKIQNECNGRLLAGQMELVRSLLQQPAGYPASAF
jgi:flagella synthesis protein FlgN